ncbi:MAG TPA: hypothetical protein VG367_17645 [Mucilaginibacter sp.]|nr:hypothetical protein [Mucilaginibacter sp.]
MSPAQPSDETGKTDGLVGGKGIAKVAEAVALRERQWGSASRPVVLPVCGARPVRQRRLWR